MSRWGSAKRTRTTGASEEVLRSDVATNTTDMEDATELWDGDENGIDDSVLLMASQMVEGNGRKKPSTQAAVPPAVDQTELAEMSRLLEQDADWNDDDVFSEAAEAATASPSRVVAPSVVEKPPKQPKTSTMPDVFTKPRNPPAPAHAPAPRPTSKISSPDDEMKSLKDLLARREAEVKTLNDEKYSRHGEVLYLRGELSKRDEALQKERAGRARAAELRAAEVRQVEESRKAQMEKMETEAAFLRRDLENMADQVRRAKVTALKQEPEDDKKKTPRVRNGPIAIDETLLCESSPQSQRAPNANSAKIPSKLSLKHTICASVQTDGNGGREKRRRRRIVRRIRMRRDPQSRNIVTLASAVNKNMTNEVFSAAIININATGDGSAALSAAESLILNVQCHIEKRSSNAQMLVNLMMAASVFLESESLATAPQPEKESMARALKSVAAGFSSRKPIFQAVDAEEEAKGEKPPLSRKTSEQSDFDRCLATFFDVVQVAVSARAVTPGGFAAVLSTLTLCLRQVTPRAKKKLFASVREWHLFFPLDRALGAETCLSMESAVEMASTALRSAEFAQVICGECENPGNVSCVFLGSLSNALDRFIIAGGDITGTEVIGKGATG